MSWQGYAPQQGYPPQGQPHPGYSPEKPVYAAPHPNPPSPMMNNTTIINNTPATGTVKKVSLEFKFVLCRFSELASTVVLLNFNRSYSEKCF